MYKLSLSIICATLVSGAAAANEYAPAMQEFLDSEVINWANDPILVEAILAQNSETSAFEQSQIDTLDQTWRAEVGTENSPTITPVLENAAAEFLRSRVTASGGRITEVFIMDAQGLNVAASDVTSDYVMRRSLPKHMVPDPMRCTSAMWNSMSPLRSIKVRSH